MIKEDGKWYAFEDYDDERLNLRIAYWETQQSKYGDSMHVLQAMLDERDRRFYHHMLALVEQK